MAIEISKETPVGVSATYWKIISISMDTINYTVDMVVAGYLNADAREDGKEPLLKQSFTSRNSDVDYNLYFSDAVLQQKSLLESAYAFLNTQDSFIGGSQI